MKTSSRRLRYRTSVDSPETGRLVRSNQAFVIFEVPIVGSVPSIEEWLKCAIYRTIKNYNVSGDSEMV